MVYAVVVVVSFHSLHPYLWGESDHPAFGPPASISLQLASNSITPAGSVRKSRGDIVVRMWVRLNRWCVSCVCCRGAYIIYDYYFNVIFIYVLGATPIRYFVCNIHSNLKVYQV